MTLPAWLRPARSPAAPAGAALAPAQLREEVLDALGVAFAQGDLTMEELEGRLALAFRTSDPAALRELLSDLPSASAWRDANVARPAQDAPVTPERGVLAAFMGGNVRKGSWAVPRYLKVVAVMGGVQLDLRQAVLAPGLTEIEVFAVMGGVEIVVPPGVRVETMGMAVMGGFDTSAGDAHATSPDRPFIRISGLAVMGGVEAKMRLPSARAMKKFRRAVEKARKQG